MFNLDELEKNWQDYFMTKTGKDRLSNQDVLEIYKSENATLEYYNEQVDKYRNKFKKIWGIINGTPEERLIQSIYGYNSNIGWDEDISNIDKDEFINQYIENEYLHTIDKNYITDELNREDNIRQLLRAENKFDFSKLHENNEDFLLNSEIDPTDFGVDKNFIQHERSYYVEDYIFDDDYEYKYEYDYDCKNVKEQESRNRNIATRILMEKSKLEEPKKIRLSPEKQKIVVEGCMYLVFNETRFWDNATGHAFDLEELYSLCLFSLMSATKNCCHYQKPVFSLLVNETVRRNMYNLIGKRMHLTYREIYQKIANWELEHKPTDDNDYQLYDIPKKKIVEIATDPKEIFLMTKDNPTDDEYQKESKIFMESYYQTINKLNGYERNIMSMAYDNNGYLGLTNAEIADNLMIDINTVNSLKIKALIKIRNNESMKK